MSQPTAFAVAFLVELEQECGPTRSLLAKLPEGKLDWRPHPKSQSLGQLAMHVASLPENIVGMVAAGTFDASTVDFKSPQPRSTREIQEAFELGLPKARAALSGWSEADFEASWRLVMGTKELMAMPRGTVLRKLLLNHLYHHRGQLTVYLRLLDVPLPSVYGPTADAAVFANA
ncbi:MAG: DinB family protein [Planctomycetes bacterium]|nr:DinB family protein [Planctomycetota bacterium]